MRYVLLLVVLVLASCSSTKSAAHPTLLDDQTFLLTELSTDPHYGYTEKKPIEVGGVKEGSGPRNERRFLNALAGPNGETVRYLRTGHCCPRKSENGIMGTALLDTYAVWWEGGLDTVMLYINMYDPGDLKAPLGFTIKP
jgi:hypothetical protein